MWCIVFIQCLCIPLLVLIGRCESLPVVQPAGAFEKSSTCHQVNISAGFNDREWDQYFGMHEPVLFMLNANGGKRSSRDALAAVMHVQELIHLFGNLTMTDTNSRNHLTVAGYISALRSDKDFQQLFAQSDGLAPMVDALFAQAAGRLQPFLANLNDRLIVSVGHEGTGSRMHQHGASWLYLATGTKQWLMLPPSAMPLNLDARSMSKQNRTLMAANPCTLFSAFPRVDWMSCMQRAGEVLYLPAGTWHATCNHGSSEDGYASDSRKKEVVMGAGAQGFAKASKELFYASRDGHVALIRRICAAEQPRPSSQVAPLLSTRGKQESHRSPKRFSQKELPDTAMHVAASHDRVAVVECLMSAHCGGSWMIYAPTGSAGNQPIHEAAKFGSLDVLNLLLMTVPALINATSLLLGNTPLHLAARKGHTATAEFLLLNRASVDTRSLTGMTALHEAVQTSQINMLELLIAHGADCLIPDGREQSLMHTALSEGHQAVLALLLNLGSQRGKKQLILLAESPDKSRKHWQKPVLQALLNASSSLGALAAEVVGTTGTEFSDGLLQGLAISQEL